MRALVTTAMTGAALCAAIIGIAPAAAAGYPDSQDPADPVMLGASHHARDKTGRKA